MGNVGLTGLTVGADGFLVAYAWPILQPGLEGSATAILSVLTVNALGRFRGRLRGAGVARGATVKLRRASLARLGDAATSGAATPPCAEGSDGADPGEPWRLDVVSRSGRGLHLRRSAGRSEQQDEHHCDGRTGQGGVRRQVLRVAETEQV